MSEGGNLKSALELSLACFIYITTIKNLYILKYDNEEKEKG